MQAILVCLTVLGVNASLVADQTSHSLDSFDDYSDTYAPPATFLSDELEDEESSAQRRELRKGSSSSSPSTSYYKSTSSYSKTSYKYYVNTYYSGTYGQKYSTVASKPTYTNSYFSNGKTYQPFYVYYKPAGWYNPIGYYSTTFLLVYYDGYGYNFYYGRYGYYEYSVNERRAANDMVFVIATVVGILAIILICYCVIKSRKASGENDDGEKSHEEVQQVEVVQEHFTKVEERTDVYNAATQPAYPPGAGPVPPAYPPVEPSEEIRMPLHLDRFSLSSGCLQ